MIDPVQLRNLARRLPMAMVVLSALLLAGAVGLWSLGGAHAGFAPVNALGPLMPDRFWSLLTCLGDSAVALALFLLVARRNLHLCRVILIASLLGLLWTHGFKQFLPLPRPAGVLPPGSFHAVGELARSETFPSGHSQSAMTLAAVMALCLRSRLWQAVVLLVGLAAAASRVVVGMHWPVDVLAGAAGGLICAVLAVAMSRRLGPQGSGPVFAVIPLCLIAAGMVAAGHPPDYPDAQPWLRAIGVVGPVVFVWPWLRRTARPGP